MVTWDQKMQGVGRRTRYIAERNNWIRRLYGQGMRAWQIANMLDIPENTVMYVIYDDNDE